MPRAQITVACLLILFLSLLSCSSMPRAQVELPSAIGGIQYQGEIKGRFGSRELVSPQAIVCDQNGNLYIADTGNNRILKLNGQFEFVAESGGFGSDVGSLNRPVDIVSDGGINFFVLDQGNRRVVRFDYNLVFTDAVQFDDDPELISAGRVVRIGHSEIGRLYLVDPDNLRVLMLDTDYALERTLLAPGGFADCAAINVVPDGSVFVYDAGDQNIYGFDAYGNSAGNVTLNDVGSIGGFIVTRGYIVASDSRRNEVAIFDRSGRKLLMAGSYGSGPYNLDAPSGVALRSDGTLFVCDSGNNRITYYELIPD